MIQNKWDSSKAALHETDNLLYTFGYGYLIISFFNIPIKRIALDTRNIIAREIDYDKIL